MLVVKVENQRKDRVFTLDFERSTARPEIDEADLFKDPWNPIHWLPRARLTSHGIEYGNKVFRIVGGRQVVCS